MTKPTINKINAGVAHYDVEIAKGRGYFYFYGLSDEGQMTADSIESVMSDVLSCNSLEEWWEYVDEQIKENQI